MRYVSRYHATTAPAPTVRAVACQLGGTERSVIITYTASNSVVTIATRRPRRDAFRVTSFEHLGHRSPTAMPAVVVPQRARSEEHTSELQSQSNLVCRLLLEKKKKY